MLKEYIQAAMETADYEIIQEESGEKYYYGSILACEGLWAKGSTLAKCQKELEETLEEWILLGLQLKHKLPKINNLEIVYPEYKAA